MPSSSCQMKTPTGSSASMNFSSASAHPSTHQRKVGILGLYWGTSGVPIRGERRGISFQSDLDAVTPRVHVDGLLTHLPSYSTPCSSIPALSTALLLLSHSSCDGKGLHFPSRDVGQVDKARWERQRVYLTARR